jgi:peroxiredoxin
MGIPVLPVKLEMSAARYSLEHLGDELGIREAAKDFAKAYEMDYPLFVAGAKGIPLMQALGNTKGGLPFTLVIDRNGQVIQKKLGVMKKADLDAAAELLLKVR